MNDVSHYLWLNLKQFYQLNIIQVLWDSSTSCSLQIRNLEAIKTRLVKFQKNFTAWNLQQFYEMSKNWRLICCFKACFMRSSCSQQSISRTFQFRGLQKLETGKIEGQGQDQWGEGYGIISFPEILHLLCVAQLSKGSFARVAAVPFFLKWTFHCTLQWVRSCYFLPHFTTDKLRHKTIRKLTKGVEHTCSS